MKNNKSGLSSGFQTDVSKKLSKILYTKNTEFVCQLEDKYMKLALEEFLNDLNFKNTKSNGDFVLISIKKGVYKFYNKIPYDTRVYDIPSEWDIFKMKIEKILSKSPLKIKEKVESVDKENKKEEESRIYLLDKDNYRFYKGYISHNGEVFEINTYDNKISIKDIDGNDIDDVKLSKVVYKNEINIYTNKPDSKISDNNKKLKVYDSKKDGELKTKMEIEIEERKDELKEKGHIVLSDGKVVTINNNNGKENNEE